MSSINNAAIAASVSQALVQQKQVARAQDADKNLKQELARRLREQAEQHARSVEDPTETTDQSMRVQGEQPHDEQNDRKRRDPRHDSDATPEQAGPHVDVEA